MSVSPTPIKTGKISVIDMETSSIPSISESDCDVKLVDKHPEKEVTKESFTSGFIKLAVAAICGIFFGISLEKCRVFEPRVIREQMVFENFVMIKAFLSAAAMGQICLAVLSVLPITKTKFEKASEEYVSGFSEKGILSSAVGAFVLGSGMTLAGACPGMVLAQVGAWVPNAVFTFLGALMGAVLYGMLATFFEKITRPKQPFEKQQVHTKLGVPFIAIAIPMAVILIVVVFVIEWFWPWTKDMDRIGRRNTGDMNVITAVSWPPYASGIIIGILQVPLVLVLTDTVGGSSGYVTVMSQWVITDKLQKRFPYLASRRTGVGNWWQVIYVTGAIVGAAISAATSHSFNVALGAPVHTAIFGGLLMLLGARLASGCTSGHGLSGFGLLAWLSFIAVPFMFGGAIVTGFSMQATGALDTYVRSTGAIN